MLSISPSVIVHRIMKYSHAIMCLAMVARERMMVVLSTLVRCSCRSYALRAALFCQCKEMLFRRISNRTNAQHYFLLVSHFFACCLKGELSSINKYKNALPIEMA